MSSSSLLNAQFFIKLIVFHVQIIDLVLVEGFFVQAASEALLDILHSQPLLLKLLLCDLELYLVLTKLLLLPIDNLLEGVRVTLVALEDSYVSLESLVNLLSCAQLRS